MTIAPGPRNMDEFEEEGRKRQSEKPCATCNGDPEVCATVPGLRHCEAANRQSEKLHERLHALALRLMTTTEFGKDAHTVMEASVALSARRNKT